MTGTFEQSATARMRLSPPRGMQRSTYCVSDSRIGIASRSGVGTTWIACSGNSWWGEAPDEPAREDARPTEFASACLPASIIVFALIWLEFHASWPPRRIVALPDLKHRLAASAVTLGRDS